jgi:hypothetical protein
MHKALLIYVMTAFSCCLLMGSSIAQNSESQEKVTIQSIIGKAEVKAANSGAWRDARAGMIVKMSWDVRTYVESSVELYFESGTVLKLGENSVINLSTILVDKNSNSSTSKIKVATGQLLANVSKLVNKKSEFSFETPTAVAAIRGTNLRLIVDKDKTILDVYEGRVRMRNKGSKKEIDVTTRNRAVVKNGESGVDLYKFEDVPKDTAAANSGKNPVSIPQDSVYTKTDSVKTPSDSIKTKTDTLTKKGLSPDEILKKEPIDTVKNDKKPPVQETKIIPDKKTEVSVTIDAPENNSVVTEGRITLRGTATAGAKVMAGSKAVVAKSDGSFSATLELVAGSNRIVVTAQSGTATAAAVLTVEYRQPRTLFLTLSQPAQNLSVDNPLIQIKGTTLSGAEVTVEGNGVTVAQDGSFSYQEHIPDEPGEYTIVITSRYNGKEVKEQRTIIYKPKREKMFLNVFKPVAGQIIKTNMLTVSGQSIGRSTIEVNGRRIITPDNGLFNADFALAEKDIGDYTLEITASDNDAGQEISKSITVMVDIKSPQINTNAPRVAIVSESQGATKLSFITIQAFDRTPQDVLNVKIKNNGASASYTMDPNDQERFSLDVGKNVYTIDAVDLAGNVSNAVNNQLFYLPGPLVIDVQEPADNNMTIDDLPPMPVNVGALMMNLVIKIDDGIGNIPETIRYCRVNTMNLKKGNNYQYTGKIEVKRGLNVFVVETEDIAGNKERKQFEVTIKD